MIAWNTEVIARHKTGSVARVMLFGDGVDRAQKPYVVVKPIAGGDRKLLQIIVHGALGTADMLEAYVFRELPALLKEPLVAGGKTVHVLSTGGWLGHYTDGEDNTLAMSRDFYLPVIL